MEKEEDVFDIENSYIVELPKDIKEITEGVRESFYFLDGLLALDLVYQGLDPNDSLDIENQHTLFNKEFEYLENNLYFSDLENNLVGHPDDEKLKHIVKSYILLKEKVDSFQLKMLTQIIDSSYKTLKFLTSERPYLERYSTQVYSIFLIKSAFLHSHAENKKITYFFLIQDKEKYVTNKNPFENYAHATVTDYSYKLYRERIRVETIYEHLFKLIFSIQEIDEKKHLDSLVKAQYSFNKQMVILTYIIAFLTIVMTIASLLA